VRKTEYYKSVLNNHTVNGFIGLPYIIQQYFCVWEILSCFVGVDRVVRHIYFAVGSFVMTLMCVAKLVYATSLWWSFIHNGW